LSLPVEAQHLLPLQLEGMWRLIVGKEKDFGRAGQLPLRSLTKFESLLAILILTVREEENSSPGPLERRYMEQL
jgi:hypothetical protein